MVITRLVYDRHRCYFVFEPFFVPVRVIMLPTLYLAIFQMSRYIFFDNNTHINRQATTNTWQKHDGGDGGGDDDNVVHGDDAVVVAVAVAVTRSSAAHGKGLSST